MVEIPSGRPAVTWDELTAKNPEVTEDWEADGEVPAEDGDSYSFKESHLGLLIRNGDIVNADSRYARGHLRRE